MKNATIWMIFKHCGDMPMATYMHELLLRETLYQESCHPIYFTQFHAIWFLVEFLQFLWFMNPFIKCVMEKGAAGKPLCSGNIAYCMKCIKAFFLAFLPMALGRSASQFIFKIYVSWCSFAPLFFLAFLEKKNKGNSSSFVMPFLQN